MNTPLHVACSRGLKENVEQLVSSGADVNAKNNKGDTPLHLACSVGQKKIVEYLISKGANFTDKNSRGDTALHNACFNGQLKVVELLVSRAADISAKNNEGETPLSIAASSSQKEIAQYIAGRLVLRKIPRNADNAIEFNVTVASISADTKGSLWYLCGDETASFALRLDNDQHAQTLRPGMELVVKVFVDEISNGKLQLFVRPRVEPTYPGFAVLADHETKRRVTIGAQALIIDQQGRILLFRNVGSSIFAADFKCTINSYLNGTTSFDLDRVVKNINMWLPFELEWVREGDLRTIFKEKPEYQEGWLEGARWRKVTKQLKDAAENEIGQRCAKSAATPEWRLPGGPFALLAAGPEFARVESAAECAARVVEEETKVKPSLDSLTQHQPFMYHDEELPHESSIVLVVRYDSRSMGSPQDGLLQKVVWLPVSRFDQTSNNGSNSALSMAEFTFFKNRPRLVRLIQNRVKYILKK